MAIDFPAMTLSQFSSFLDATLDRLVIDKTGLTGRFNFHLQFAIDEATPGAGPAPPSDEPAGPSIFTAVQEQLGLRLQSAKGPGQFYVIDHVERPSEN